MTFSPTPGAPEHLVTTVEQLEVLYGQPSGRSLIKELDHISAHYRAFIEAAPFVVVATSGPEGLDCSPRGDPPGFVRVLDERTLALPDRRGNNRIDSLRNVIRDPRISLLFLVPGVGETIRVNGTAAISTDPRLCADFAMEGKLPKSVLLVTVGTIYYQCSKALIRSQLWSPEAQVPRDSLPSVGQLVESSSQGAYDAAEVDRTYPERMKQTIY